MSADKLEQEIGKLRETLGKLKQVKTKKSTAAERANITKQITTIERSIADAEQTLRSLRKDSAIVAWICLLVAIAAWVLWTILDLPHPLAWLEKLRQSRQAVSGAIPEQDNF